MSASVVDSQGELGSKHPASGRLQPSISSSLHTDPPKSQSQRSNEVGVEASTKKFSADRYVSRLDCGYRRETRLLLGWDTGGLDVGRANS